MLERVAAMIARISSLLAGVVLVGMAGYTIVEIVSRKALGSGSNVLVEFIGYGLATMTFLGAAQTMREGGLIRVNVVLHFAPPRVHQILDAFCLLCGIAVIAFAAHFVWLDILRSYTRGYETDSLVALPLWLPPLGLLVGMVVFLLDMLVHLILVVVRGQRLADESPEAL
jgi:TRAP-type C4-dicarboxylate transport system permease small subunit